MPEPRVFEHPIRVALEDIDRMNHVNNVVYLRYAQDVAVAHWRRDAPAEHRDAYAWVVRRHEVDYLKPAFHGDDLIARTWISAAVGATLERTVEVRRRGQGGHDDEVVARIKSLWVPLDAASMRPRRISHAIKSAFLDASSGADSHDG